MIINLMIQVRDNNKIWYELEEDKITVTINDITDTFDFTDMPDGEFNKYDKKGILTVESILPEVPVYKAVKKDGELTVDILFTISPLEHDQRLLFPEPMSLEEFNDLMEEIAERDKEDEVDGEDVVEE